MRTISAIIAITAVSVCASGCGGIECDLEKRNGTYRVEYIETAGDCGPIPTQYVSASDPGDGSCTLNSSDVSEDQCTTTVDIRCVSATGDVMLLTQELTQISDDGSELEGEATVGYANANGSCGSVYDVKMTRL